MCIIIIDGGEITFWKTEIIAEITFFTFLIIAEITVKMI